MVRGKSKSDSKIDKAAIASIIEEVNETHGEGSLYTIDGRGQDLAMKRIPIGIEQFDNAIGGGIPSGRIIELFGVNSSGKTTLAYKMCAQYEVAVFIDGEGTFDSALAKVHGNKKGQLLVQRPKYGEQAWDMILRFAKAGVPLIVLDSVPSLASKKELEMTDMEKQPDVAPIARLMSRKMPVLNAIADDTGTTVVFINQMRTKIGGPAFGDPFDTPGGNALKHAASLRIRISRKQWLEHPKLGRFGQISKVRVDKSKVCQPFREAELTMVFSRGFVDFANMDQIKKELLKELREGKIERIPTEAEELGLEPLEEAETESE